MYCFENFNTKETSFWQKGWVSVTGWASSSKLVCQQSRFWCVATSYGGCTCHAGVLALLDLSDQKSFAVAAADSVCLSVNSFPGNAGTQGYQKMKRG